MRTRQFKARAWYLSAAQAQWYLRVSCVILGSTWKVGLERGNAVLGAGEGMPNCFQSNLVP